MTDDILSDKTATATVFLKSYLKLLDEDNGKNPGMREYAFKGIVRESSTSKRYTLGYLDNLFNDTGTAGTGDKFREALAKAATDEEYETRKKLLESGFSELESDDNVNAKDRGLGGAGKRVKEFIKDADKIDAYIEILEARQKVKKSEISQDDLDNLEKSFGNDDKDELAIMDVMVKNNLLNVRKTILDRVKEQQNNAKIKKKEDLDKRANPPAPTSTSTDDNINNQTASEEQQEQEQEQEQEKGFVDSQEGGKVSFEKNRGHFLDALDEVGLTNEKGTIRYDKKNEGGLVCKLPGKGVIKLCDNKTEYIEPIQVDPSKRKEQMEKDAEVIVKTYRQKGIYNLTITGSKEFRNSVHNAIEKANEEARKMGGKEIACIDKVAKDADEEIAKEMKDNLMNKKSSSALKYAKRMQEKYGIDLIDDKGELRKRDDLTKEIEKYSKGTKGQSFTLTEQERKKKGVKKGAENLLIKAVPNLLSRFDAYVVNSRSKSK